MLGSSRCSVRPVRSLGFWKSYHDGVSGSDRTKNKGYVFLCILVFGGAIGGIKAVGKFSLWIWYLVGFILYLRFFVQRCVFSRCSSDLFGSRCYGVWMLQVSISSRVVGGLLPLIANV